MLISDRNPNPLPVVRRSGSADQPWHEVPPLPVGTLTAPLFRYNSRFRHRIPAILPIPLAIFCKFRQKIWNFRPIRSSAKDILQGFPLELQDSAAFRRRFCTVPAMRNSVAFRQQKSVGEYPNSAIPLNFGKMAHSATSAANTAVRT